MKEKVLVGLYVVYLSGEFTWVQECWRFIDFKIQKVASLYCQWSLFIGYTLLRLSRNSSKSSILWIQIMNTPSMYLNQSIGCLVLSPNVFAGSYRQQTKQFAWRRIKRNVLIFPTTVLVTAQTSGESDCVMCKCDIITIVACVHPFQHHPEKVLVTHVL